LLNALAESTIMRVIAAGFIAAADNSDAIVFQGVERPIRKTEYGWIEPVPAVASGTRFAPIQVRQFWEKPSVANAEDLLRLGCLSDQTDRALRVRHSSTRRRSSERSGTPASPPLPTHPLSTVRAHS
jgi:hypothetical protein